MRKKILVIDDDMELVDYLKTGLELEEYLVVTAYDGVSGLRKVKDKNPDLILLDIALPDIDGHQICKEIKNNTVTKDIPVIIITAKDPDKELRKSFGEGADWFIMKPFDCRYLLDTVNSFINRKYAFQ